MYYFVELNDQLSTMLLGVIGFIGGPLLGMILGLALIFASPFIPPL